MDIEVTKFVQFARHDDQLMKIKMNTMSERWHRCIMEQSASVQLGEGLEKAPYCEARLAKTARTYDGVRYCRALTRIGQGLGWWSVHSRLRRWVSDRGGG